MRRELLYLLAASSIIASVLVACGVDVIGGNGAIDPLGADGSVTDREGGGIGPDGGALGPDGEVLGDAAASCDAGDADLTTSPSHCGSCGHDCLGGACEAGVCSPIVIAAAEQEPQGLAIDATRIYWTNTGAGGRIRTCPVAGCNGSPTTLASGLASPNAVIASSSSSGASGGDVYWTNYSDSRLMKCAIGGCNLTPVTYATMSPASSGFGRLAIDATTLFFTDAGNSKVHSCVLGASSCTPAVLATNQPSPWGIAVDDLNVYWVNDNATGSVEKCPKTGCGANNGLRVTLASNQGNPRTLAIDATHVYWANQTTGFVMSCAKTGCNSAPNPLSSGLANPHGIAVDDTHVYFTERTTNSIKKVPKTGGPTKLVASAQANPFNVVVDAKAIYWTNWIAVGSVMRLAK